MYDTTGVLLSVGTREDFGQKTECFRNVGIPGSDPRVSLKQLPVMSTRPANDAFLADHDLTRAMSFTSHLDPTRPSRC